MIHYTVVDEIIQLGGKVLKAYLQDQYLRKEKIMGKLSNLNCNNLNKTLIVHCKNISKLYYIFCMKFYIYYRA